MKDHLYKQLVELLEMLMAGNMYADKIINQ